MDTIPLFERYPVLATRLPRLALASLPTPIARLEHMGDDRVSVYVKRDDVTGEVYGGNKVRKLEFLFGKALAEKRRRVITVGAAGSNHALATALYARDCGLRAALMLFPQPNAQAVRDNLLADLSTGAELHPCDDYTRFQAHVDALRAHYRQVDGVEPMLIPAGGSAPEGVVGYVNAGLELAAQIEAGQMPRPARIYVALGTMGTAVGLLLGLRIAQLPIEVIGVRVVPTVLASEKRMRALFDETNRLLHNLDPSFPLLHPESSWFRVEHGFFGTEYGRFTPAAVEAVARLPASAGFALDGTYTGKAFAALRAQVSELAPGASVLYWHTRNSRPRPATLLQADSHQLPRELWTYFETPTQEEAAAG